MLSDEHLLQALVSAGVAGRNVVYISLPITSGYREVELMGRMGVRSAGALRRDEPARWRREVLEPNEIEAEKVAGAVRQAPWLSAGSVVIDPSRISVKGWDQDDYNRFWVRLMGEHVRSLVATQGWEYSRGARTEVGYALTFDPHELQIIDGCGSPLRKDDVRATADEARQKLAGMGWDQVEIDAYLPALAESKPDLVPSAQSQTFGWLIAERRFQVRQFGSAADDQHLRVDGLAPSGWWVRRLISYLQRAQEASLTEGATRVDLAKLTATAVALLESVIRVHGPIPPGKSHDT